MATYKVWLTVKDRYGNTKEIDGGDINVGLDELTRDEVDYIEEALPLEEYLKKSEINTELDHFATDVEVDEAVKNKGSMNYSDFEFKAEGEE
jgi:hypothetical protein